MRLDNVFYGFTKNGERKLLWKRYKTEWTSMGDIVRSVFYDLEEKEYYETNDIDKKSLIPIVKIVGDVSRMSRRKVKKAYQADCNLLYDAAGVFYGDVVKKTTKYDLRTTNGFFIGSAGTDLYDDILIPKLENVLFARINDSKGRVQAVYTGSLFPWVDRIKKGLAVKEDRPINRDKISETVVSKKKLLELDYRKEL